MNIYLAMASLAVLSAPTPAALAQPTVDSPLAMRAGDPELQWGSCPPIFEGDCAIAVLHGNPSKPNSDVFLRIGGGTSLPAHYHTSAERMILVSGRLLVDYQGSSPSILEPGSYAYGPPGSVHTAACLGTKACTLFIAFQGPVDALLAENVVE
ncbi:cupin [Sphingopyxis bauzanensis]|uniref:Cupin n=1 Tax=Sphingopyxis bauzanensis TaxID=651663 RepID=A0A246JSH7_9SPHN|nr:cupin domain-containing protein [Sphingopyxis bauzanensis]OWQ95965.1 cupin [Sphingopyxis bauzanensis]